MAGINYYARNPAAAFSTLDYDVFLDPTLANVKKALRGFASLGFTIGTAAGTFAEGDLRAVVRDRRTLVATTTDGLMVELLLQISGYPFAAMAEDAKTVVVRGVPVHVGKLQKLLRSKRLAGRPKDRQFLRRYASLLRASTPRRRPAPRTT